MLKKIINSNENIQPFNFLVDDSINQLMSMYKSIFREDLINWMKVFKKSDFVNNIVENNNEVSSRFALLDDEYDECIKLAQKHNRGNYMLFAYSCKITNMLFTGRYRTLLETAKGLTTSFGELLRDRHRDDFYCKDFIGYYRDLIETNIEECKEVIQRLDENKEDIELKIMQNIYPEYYQKFLAAKDKKLLAEKEYRNYNIMIHTNMSNKPSILEPISYLIYLKNRYSNTERKLKQKFDEMVKANNDFIKIEKDFYDMKDNENVKVQLKAMAQIISDNKSHISDTLLLLQKERNILGKKKSE